MSLLMSFAALLSVAQADAPPSPELVDRFIAAVPGWDRPLEEIDSAFMARLVQRNPGREHDIRAILEAHALCMDPARRAAVEQMLRHVAATLGTARVEAMIGFYQGPDRARFDLLTRNDDTPEDGAEFERLLRTYPLEAFREAIYSASSAATGSDQRAFLSAMVACDRQRAEGLAGARLRE